MDELQLSSAAELEWPRLIEAIDTFATLRRLQQLPRFTVETVGAELAVVAELMEKVAINAAPLLRGGEPIEESIARAELEAVLSLSELVAIFAAVKQSVGVGRYLDAQRESLPKLRERMRSQKAVNDLCDELSLCIGDDGSLLDSASGELGALRSRCRTMRERLQRKLESMVQRRAEVLSDTFVTQREGRYVIPVRADAHERVEGIVHGLSASGASIFVEPTEVVALGNALKLAEGEVEREEFAIRSGLSIRVSESVDDIRSAWSELLDLDVKLAIAHFAHQISARVPEIAKEPTLELKNLRHPLLVREMGNSVVANDIHIAGGRAVVISGPNAGGKTVMLKASGLCAMMVAHGVPIPVDAGSVISADWRVFSDIGDHQSLQLSLSTFSAHVARVAAILDRAGEHSLFLFDELAAGTDPEEGAALSCAVVRHAMKAGAAVITTTHYEALKELAMTDTLMECASMGINSEDMSPTYKMRWGVPGQSSALWVAARKGMPEAIIEDAKSRLGDRPEEQLLGRLHSMLDEAASSAAELSKERRQAQSDAIRFRKQAEKLREKRKDMDAKALRETRTMRKDFDKALRDLKKERKQESRTAELQKAAAIKAKLDAAEAKAKMSSQRDEQLPSVKDAPIDAQVGKLYWSRSLRRDVKLVELDGKRARVAAGVMKMWVELRDLSERDKARTPATKVRANRAPRLQADDSLDVRGMRYEDAGQLVETSVDRAYGANMGKLVIRHGVGSGALQQSVHKTLDQLKRRYKLEFRFAADDEGGSGSTIVELASG